jgi:hypothetical protein
MPHQYTVLIKWKPSITPQRIDEHLAGIRSLSQHVPSISELTLAAQHTDLAGRCSHGFTAIFGTREDELRFILHPYFRRIAALLEQDAYITAVGGDI